ncbi:MAG: protein-inosine monophosphate dehydrogenase [Gammaproteobacteria bacterium]|nr:MAG: protein-inosine monophosphate dehydrogenase [Gammaproteobacteria bacterium]
MVSKPITIKADASIEKAMQVIIEHKISGLCVVDDRDNLIGVLSEMDCLKAVLDATYSQRAAGSVEEHMTGDNLIVANPNEDIVDVAQDMLRINKRRRPVVEHGKLIGQVTCRHLLEAVRNFQS